MKRGLFSIVMLALALTGCVSNTPHDMADIVPNLDKQNPTNKRIFDNEGVTVQMAFNPATKSLEASNVNATIVPKAQVESERLAAYGTFFGGAFGGTGQLLNGVANVKDAFHPETRKFKVDERHSGSMTLNKNVNGRVEQV